MYPWESCPIHGKEVTPGPSAPTKGHATLDVALAFAQFVHATGDRDYLRRVAWPVIHEVAQWTESRVERTRRGFELREMTGPAEADPPRDNNAFVNMGARLLLDEAIQAAERLGEEPRRAVGRDPGPSRAARATRGRSIPNDDDYRVDELKGGTPEAAAGIFPMGFRVPPPSRRRRSVSPSRSRRRATSGRRCCRRSSRTTRPGPAARPRRRSFSRRATATSSTSRPRDR